MRVVIMSYLCRHVRLIMNEFLLDKERFGTNVCFNNEEFARCACKRAIEHESKRGFNSDGKGGRSEGCSAERSDTVRVGGR